MPTKADSCRQFIIPKLPAAVTEVGLPARLGRRASCRLDRTETSPYSIAEHRSITDGHIVPVEKGFVRRLPKRVDSLPVRAGLLRPRPDPVVPTPAEPDRTPRTYRWDVLELNDEEQVADLRNLLLEKFKEPRLASGKTGRSTPERSPMRFAVSGIANEILLRE